MSIDCYCHPKSFECETMYDGKPRYPRPAPLVHTIATLPQQLAIYHDAPVEWIILPR